MITANEIAYDIMELIRGNHISQNTDLDIRQILYQVHNQRALWIRNEYNKPGRHIDHNLIQDLGCVALESVDTSECPEFPADCTILRSVKEIPNTIEFHDRTGIVRVGPLDKMNVPFSFVSYYQAIYTGDSKYNRNIVSAFLYNNKMYLKVNDNEIAKMLEAINIRGVFEDPEEAAKFNKTDGTPCYTNDSKYPVNAWMIPFIKQQVLVQLGTALQIPKDLANDAKEDLNK